MAASVIEDYKKLMLEIRSGNFRPVYMLHGEESFFIDHLSEEIERTCLEEHERDFNQTIVYAADTDPDMIKDTCLRFPMMAERQLVIVRELQAWRITEVEKLENYLAKPTPTTVLVLCYKHNKVDGRKSILKTIQKAGGAVFLSDKLKEEKIPDVLISIAKNQKRKLGPSEARLLATHLGSDLAKSVKEVEKLCLVTGEDGTITNDIIHKFVGISKDHNIFELQNAIGNRNVVKAMQIAQYFGSDQKNNPLPLTIAFLNVYFAKVAAVHSLQGKSQQEMASAMKVPPFFLKDYIAHARNYSLGKLVSIQRDLRECDLRSKGVGGDGGDPGELLRELIAKVMS